MRNVVVAALLTLLLSHASLAEGGAPTLGWQVVSTRPHDAGAWTQGLQLDPQGRLYESTGLTGQSTLRQVDPESGEILHRKELPVDLFAEGLASAENRLIQLTWKDGMAFAWEPDTFELLDTFQYDGEGWGLCHDGDRLVMSDGSSRLTFRDLDTFEIVASVDVTLDGEPAGRFNELECVDGLVWADLYPTEWIARIDPVRGEVTGLLDLGPLVEEQRVRGGDILNGIAYDAAADTYLVTGKLWPQLFEIRILESGTAPSG